ncbi:MAG: hypothetical protein Q9192_005047, partial [Flavoplaca navasiana]
RPSNAYHCDVDTIPFLYATRWSRADFGWRDFCAFRTYTQADLTDVRSKFPKGVKKLVLVYTNPNTDPR